MAGACAKTGVVNETARSAKEALRSVKHDFANLELQQAAATRVSRERSSQPDWSQLAAPYSAFGTVRHSPRG